MKQKKDERKAIRISPKLYKKIDNMKLIIKKNGLKKIETWEEILWRISK